MLLKVVAYDHYIRAGCISVKHLLRCANASAYDEGKVHRLAYCAYDLSADGRFCSAAGFQIDELFA